MNRETRRKPRVAARALLALGTVLAAAACTDKNPESCLAGLDAHRAAIDADYVGGEESPLNEQQKASFTGLNYFPGNADLCVSATFTESVNRDVIEMPTFEESSMQFREFGEFSFRLNGDDFSLTAYQRMDIPEDQRQWVLIPFKDTTNGRETYGGGRYLVIGLPIGPSATIDFNRASNPWCAYGPGFQCPVPPAKNWLKTRIEAGEKDFEAADTPATDITAR